MARAGPARATPRPELQLRTLTLKFLPEARALDPVKPEESITIAIANDNNDQKCEKSRKTSSLVALDQHKMRLQKFGFEPKTRTRR